MQSKSMCRIEFFFLRKKSQSIKKNLWLLKLKCIKSFIKFVIEFISISIIHNDI